MDLHAILNSITSFISLVALKLVNWFDLDFWECVFIFMCSLFVLLFHRLSNIKENGVDAADLLIDSDTGKVTIKKLGALVALATSTWWTAKMAGSSALTIEFAALYVLTWTGVYVGMPVANAFANRVTPTPVRGSTETTTVVSSTEKTEVKP